MTRKIALDMDSTLAATSLRVFELIEGPDHGYTYDDILSWHWPIETFGKDAFLDAFEVAWRESPTKIEPMEPGLDETVRDLRTKYDVHILTAQPEDKRITHGKKLWLNYHGIGYDDFQTVDTSISKGTLGYNIYIDDKDSLPNECDPEDDVYLRRHKYNADADGEYTPVRSVREAADNLLNGIA